MKLHVAIVGPIAIADVRAFLHDNTGSLPHGYGGAPIMGVLIGELLSRGIRVSAFTTSSDISEREGLITAKGDDFCLHIIPARRRAWRPNGFRPGRALDFFAVERHGLLRAIRDANPDVIHAHWTYEFALAALASKRPCLITCHDAPQVVARYTRSPYRMIRYLMARQVFRRAKYLTAVSPYMCSMIQGYTRQEVWVIPNPLAPYVMAHARVRDVPESRRVAMVCNGWDRRKNPEIALKAFARFLRIDPDAQLHLFGNGFGPGEAAEGWATTNKLMEGVHFHGSVPHKSLVAQLSQMDVLLHPALEESFGVVVAEAMALGLPVVAGHESGAVPWVVGLEDGSEAASLLCDVRDVKAIVQRLECAFDDRYGIRSKAGVARATSLYSAKAVCSAYVECYDRAFNDDELAAETANLLHRGGR
jgi:glycosyltransferase involved in cell wall biosynthesis